MVKRTITITTFFLILTMVVSLIVMLNKSSIAANEEPFQETGTHGTCSWMLQEGTLTIYPSNNESGTLANISYEYLQPWYNMNKNDITKIVISNGVHLPENCCGLFYKFSKCEEFDLSGLDTTNAVNIRNMFYYCETIESIDLSGFNTSNLKKISGLFAYCSKLNSIDLSTWDMSNIDDVCVAGINTNSNSWGAIGSNGAFNSCNNVTSIILPNSFDASKVTSLNHVFSNCYKLNSIDVSRWDTSNVTDMNGVFNNCRALTSLNVSNFDTSKVTDMSYMFNYCSRLNSIDVSSFDTSKVTTMCNMFDDCSNLTTLNLENFNTSKVTDMKYMFDSCYKLSSINLTSFNTELVT